jgi:hypothetical protein
MRTRVTEVAHGGEVKFIALEDTDNHPFPESTPASG